MRRADIAIHASAQSPVSGGPAKKPQYSAVLTAAMPWPALIPGMLLAVRNRLGMRLDSPNLHGRNHIASTPAAAVGLLGLKATREAQSMVRTIGARR